MPVTLSKLRPLRSTLAVVNNSAKSVSNAEMDVGGGPLDTKRAEAFQRVVCECLLSLSRDNSYSIGRNFNRKRQGGKRNEWLQISAVDYAFRGSRFWKCGDRTARAIRRLAYFNRLSHVAHMLRAFTRTNRNTRDEEPDKTEREQRGDESLERKASRQHRRDHTQYDSLCAIVDRLHNMH